MKNLQKCTIIISNNLDLRYELPDSEFKKKLTFCYHIKINKKYFKEKF